MTNHKHFTLSERINIESLLKAALSFKAIAKELDRDCTSISREIKKHSIVKKTGCYGKPFNNCIHRFSCKLSFVCENPVCTHQLCRYCNMCCAVCKNFVEDKCVKLTLPPYVCNGCESLKKCTLVKRTYSASLAQKTYETLRSESRSGITINEDDTIRLDNIISPLIQKGQSIHHICSVNQDSIMCSEKTIYNYIGSSLFSARNLDLPRKVKYRPRKKSNSSFKVDKSCRIGRTYDDYIKFLSENPDTPVVEMDSVEGIKGGKVLLTILFRGSQFMLSFLRDANTSRSVIEVFDRLYLELGPDTFTTLFPVILTDNGSEFSNPSAIEFDCQGNRRTRIFYCDPSSPYQKPHVENNHELIRRVIPKGTSLNNFTQKDIALMMNHINSYGRKRLNNQSPQQIFSLLYKKVTLEKLEAWLIPPNEITLSPNLLKK